MDQRAPAEIADSIVEMRLPQFQRTTGLPIVFGGATVGSTSRRDLRIGHVRGAIGDGLVDLEVGCGRGLGGSVIVSGALRMVRDYASTKAITHDFDTIVVHEERISSIFAVPLVVDRTVEAVLYGGLRGPLKIGDVVLDQAAQFGKRLEAELTNVLRRPVADSAEAVSLRHTRAAISELEQFAATTPDRARSATLQRLIFELRDVVAAEPLASSAPRSLAPREVDVLRLAGVGMTNAEVATSLGLRTETVRAYLRSAMRKLGVRNRTAAAHVARESNLL